MGQRELIEVQTFPFQEFVAVSNDDSSMVVLAKGINAYRAREDGTVTLILRRAIEWLTETDIEHRSGDAGPFMYVPGARCERNVTHEIALLICDSKADDMTVHQWNVGFQNPPLIVEHHGIGDQTEWRVLHENIPMSGFFMTDGKLFARFYNPTAKKQTFRKTYRKTDIWGHPETQTKHIAPKEIATIQLDVELPPLRNLSNQPSFSTLIRPAWRVGENKGHPDAQILEQLKKKIDELEIEVKFIEEKLKGTKQSERYQLQHTYYVIKRRLYEMRLSLLLNEKVETADRLGDGDLDTIDHQLYSLGSELNELRIRRRIYDYVVEALDDA